MKIKDFANMLDGRYEGDEISAAEECIAKSEGFVVVYGYSDDNVEFRGAIDEEMGCYGGRDVYLDADGILEDCECECKYYKKAISEAILLKIYCEEAGYYWEYDIDVPYETFDILDEEGNKWCRGIVFNIKDLNSGR